MKLITDRTRRSRTHRFEHNFSKLVESDVKTLNEVLQIQRSSEIISANDWRKKINLPERQDEKANEYYNPNTKSNTPAAATTATDTAVSDKASGTSDTAAAGSAQMSKPFQKMLYQSMIRASRRLTTVSRNKAKKPNDLLVWCDTRAAEHSSIVVEELEIPLQCCLPESRASVVLMATQAWLTTSLTSGVATYLEPPHKPGDLSVSVDAFCGTFMETVCDRWQKEILDDTFN